MTTERRCSKCHQVIPETPAGPIATRLHIQHCGRWLFTVAGKSGLWCSAPDRDEPGAEMVDAILDDYRRGRGMNKRLYRLSALTAQVFGALTEAAVASREGL